MKKYLFLFTFLFANLCFAASDPVNVLNSIANQMISNLRTHQATLHSNPQYVYSLAYKIIVPHADIAEMSKRVLPPQTWNSATSAERSQFQREFTALLVRTYASALAEYKDETVKFFPVRGAEGNSVKVDSQIIRTAGPSIAVSYRLVRHGGDWKVYDLVVEGVSMLESFRSQFADKLSQGNMGQLINDLRQHNAANAG